MKYMLLTSLCMLSLCFVACQQVPVVVAPFNPPPPSFVRVIPTPTVIAINPDAAFEQQVQDYNYARQSRNRNNRRATIPAPYANNTEQSVAADDTAPLEAIDPDQMALLEQPSRNSNVGSMDYKVKITNGTPNRLFIEAQDAKGTIYPCGFMQANQSFTTPMTQAAPVQGPVLIVVRDPDQPGAPELRRYRIATPTASYDGRTLHFTVIPKGCYKAAIDEHVYFISESED